MRPAQRRRRLIEIEAVPWTVVWELVSSKICVVVTQNDCPRASLRAIAVPARMSLPPYGGKEVQLHEHRPCDSHSGWTEGWGPVTDASGRSQGRTAAVVLIIGRHILQALMQPDGVVVGPAQDQLGLDLAGVNDHFQVRELALQVAEKRLDPSLIVGGARTPEVLRDPGAGFHDRIHGQKGVAPNGAELPPVTSISEGVVLIA